MTLSRLHLFYSFLSCYFISIINPQTPVNTTWFDTNSNWTNTNSYIHGDLTTYHGYFSGNFNDIVWYRTFYCEQYSVVSINFTCNYGCGVENVSGDGCIMFFNNRDLAVFNTSNTLEVQYNRAYITDLTGQENVLAPCGPGKSHDSSKNPEIFFSATAAQFVSHRALNANEEFEVAFGTHSSVADITDEYLGFSYISVTCTPPTLQPTNIPTSSTLNPTSNSPTISPSAFPTVIPTIAPTVLPTLLPTTQPSIHPSVHPTTQPSIHPSVHPTAQPSIPPSLLPTANPTFPSTFPTKYPSILPTNFPSAIPTNSPTILPTSIPTFEPISTLNPTLVPSSFPTLEPTLFPSLTPTINSSTEYPTCIQFKLCLTDIDLDPITFSAFNLSSIVLNFTLQAMQEYSNLSIMLELTDILNTENNDTLLYINYCFADNISLITIKENIVMFKELIVSEIQTNMIDFLLYSNISEYFQNATLLKICLYFDDGTPSTTDIYSSSSLMPTEIQKESQAKFDIIAVLFDRDDDMFIYAWIIITFLVLCCLCFVCMLIYLNKKNHGGRKKSLTVDDGEKNARKDSDIIHIETNAMRRKSDYDVSGETDDGDSEYRMYALNRLHSDAILDKKVQNPIKKLPKPRQYFIDVQEMPGQTVIKQHVNSNSQIVPYAFGSLPAGAHEYKHSESGHVIKNQSPLMDMSHMYGDSLGTGANANKIRNLESMSGQQLMGMHDMQNSHSLSLPKPHDMSSYNVYHHVDSSSCSEEVNKKLKSKLEKKLYEKKLRPVADIDEDDEESESLHSSSSSSESESSSSSSSSNSSSSSTTGATMDTNTVASSIGSCESEEDSDLKEVELVTPGNALQVPSKQSKIFQQRILQQDMFGGSGPPPPPPLTMVQNNNNLVMLNNMRLQMGIAQHLAVNFSGIQIPKAPPPPSMTDALSHDKLKKLRKCESRNAFVGDDDTFSCGFGSRAGSSSSDGTNQ